MEAFSNRDSPYRAASFFSFNQSLRTESAKNEHRESPLEVAIRRERECLEELVKGEDDRISTLIGEAGCERSTSYYGHKYDGHRV